MTQYWVTAQQVSDICAHLEPWGNSIVSIALDQPDLFVITMSNPISEAEIKALNLVPVVV
jgi:hypothetical protein